MNKRSSKILWFIFGLLLAAQSITFGGSHNQFQTFYVKDAGSHLVFDQCFAIKKVGGSTKLHLDVKDGLTHPKTDEERECKMTETWEKDLYILDEVDVPSPPVAPNVAVYAPINIGNYADVDDYLHDFRVYVQLNEEGEVSNDVWIVIPPEKDHPTKHIEGDGEHGGSAHGVR